MLREAVIKVEIKSIPGDIGGMAWSCNTGATWEAWVQIPGRPEHAGCVCDLGWLGCWKEDTDMMILLRVPLSLAQ